MAQILHSLSYKVCSITQPKFDTFGFFILILGTSAIMDQTACCYDVTTSKTGLYVATQAGIEFCTKTLIKLIMLLAIIKINLGSKLTYVKQHTAGE